MRPQWVIKAIFFLQALNLAIEEISDYHKIIEYKISN